MREEPAAQAQAPPATGRTVLVIEDEQPVRRLVAHVLQSQGFTVLESESSLHAIELAREQARGIDFIVADVMMPGMPGPQAVREITRHHPNVRVLFITGYSGDVLAGGDIAAGTTGLLQKPFSAETLISAVRTLLS